MAKSEGSWDRLKQSGLELTSHLPLVAGYDAPFIPGFLNPNDQSVLHETLVQSIKDCEKAGVKHIIVFSGFGDNSSDGDREKQIATIAEHYYLPKFGEEKSLMELADKAGITFILEMLNTAGDPGWQSHPGYWCNSTELAVEVVSAVRAHSGLANFGLAFDVYHSKMMGEDPLEMIETFHPCISYIHVAGVLLESDGTFHADNRCEITHPKNIIDYPVVMAKLAKYLPKGTVVLLEHIPTTADVEQAIKDHRAAIVLCESKIVK